MIIANKQDITAALYKIMEDGNKAVAAGKKLKLEISEFKETRSTAQNAWYWLFCSAVAKFLDDAGLTYGEYALPYTGELIHGIHKKVLGLKTTTNLSKDAFFRDVPPSGSILVRKNRRRIYNAGTSGSIFSNERI